MRSLKERLDKVQELGNFKTRKDFANSIGISYTTMNKWIERDEITANGVLKILDKYPQVSKTYLETGTGDVLKLDTGVSNYGHGDRAKEIADAYERMSNEDKKVAYRLMQCLSKDSGRDISDEIEKAFEE